MKTIAIYDPALCCSTGVCGPEVDPKLAQFAADVKWLQERGVTVTRFNLAQNPAAFVTNDAVKAALTEKGESALPLVFADGEMVAGGAYPSREDLAAAAGLAPAHFARVTPVAAPASGCCGGEAAEKSADGCCGTDTPADSSGGSRCCG
jgi:hypothetical protein